MKKKKPVQISGWKKNIIIILMAILLVMFFAYAVESIYPSPDYNDYCSEKLNFGKIATQEQCEELSGEWEDYQNPVEDSKGYCDLYKECGQNYNTAREKYEMYLFIFNIIIGIILVIISFLIKHEIISIGILLAGAMNLVYSTIRYWAKLSNIIRTIILGIALVIIIYLTYKKLK